MLHILQCEAIAIKVQLLQSMIVLALLAHTPYRYTKEKPIRGRVRSFDSRRSYAMLL